MTIGSVHQDEINAGGAAAEEKDFEAAARASRREFDGDNGEPTADSAVDFLIIDEKCQENRKIIRRYILRLQEQQQTNRMMTMEAFDSDEAVGMGLQAMNTPGASSSKTQHKQICVWPNCLTLTCQKSTIAALTAITTAATSQAVAQLSKAG